MSSVRDGMIRFGLSLMPEPEFASASLPLFEEGIVDAVEWSFDMGWGPAGSPRWLDELTEFYGAQGWLLGHGVSYSLLGASGRHGQWLKRLSIECQQRPYRWITEHVGFLGAGRFSFSAPLPMPIDDTVTNLAIHRLNAMALAARVPVGIENLATCLSKRDAENQGEFCTSVLDAVDGIQLLDLHNLWCQSVNTGIDIETLLYALPLNRVREIHIAGGRESIGQHSGRTLRRDTHDQLVADELVELLPIAAEQCPNLDVVIYERMGSTLSNESDRAEYQQDVRRVADFVRNLPGGATAPLPSSRLLETVTEDSAALASYQAQLLNLLYAGADSDELDRALGSEHFDPDLTAIGTELVRTWGRLDP